MNICMNKVGVRIEWRKYLNECTPSGYVSLWYWVTGEYNPSRSSMGKTPILA